MIRRPLPDGDLLIPQHEHALQAGRFAARFRDLPGPREAIVRAVSLHDAGWPLSDDRPEPLPDGRSPHIFDLEPGSTVHLWRRSVAVARAAGRLEALLVSRHFARFSDEFAAEQDDAWRAWRIGVPREVEDAGSALLSFCDGLSLRLLCSPDEPLALPPGVSFQAGRGVAVIEPWPFMVAEFDDTVSGRLLPRRKWPSKADFERAWECAEVRSLTVRVRQLGSS